MNDSRGPWPEYFVWSNGLDWLVVSSELEHFWWYLMNQNVLVLSPWALMESAKPGSPES